MTNPGANPVNHGDVLNWVLDYTNNGPAGPATATITDQLAGAGTFVPGSLRVPPGWTPAWSTDGTNFQGSDQGTATVAVRGTNPNARPGGTTLDGQLLRPVQPSVTATGGDGYTPMLYRDASGKVEAWNMYHHLAAANPKLVCTDLTAGGLCAGGPWPKPVNTTPGPFGFGFTGDIASPNFQQYVKDPVRGVTYYAAITAGSIGVGCLDFAARANCGYVPLGTGSALAGMVELGGNLYGASTNGQVVCMVMATQTPCAGQPYAAVTPPNSGFYFGAMTVAVGKVFITSSPGGAVAPAIGCFDPATAAACAGWAAPKAIGPAGTTVFNAFTAYDTAGNAVGACGTRQGGVPQGVCYTIAGAPMAAPTEFGVLPSGALVLTPETITAPNGHLQSYFAAWGGGLSGGTICHDWTTGAACAGFPLPATHPNVNGGFTLDYGYAYDAVTECLIGLGDAGFLFSMEPSTGGSPCIHSGVSVALNPSAFYCDGGSGHVQGYQNARLENINLANVNLAASRVEVKDAGVVIATPAFAPDGSVDLSGISVAAHPSIEVIVHLVLNNGSDFTDTNHPTVVVSFAGDAPQVCFQTTVPAACTNTQVTNTATGTDVTGALSSNTVALPVAPGSACQPNVTVNKEICASSHIHDCTAGGHGPWKKKATVGILGLLFANPHWRITITNHGPVDIVNARVNDPVEPSCVTAAGTFTLAAGASRQVFCNTSILISLLPLTNTASATFTPANSPPGTPPTTTAPSSATACSLLCVLN